MNYNCNMQHTFEETNIFILIKCKDIFIQEVKENEHVNKKIIIFKIIVLNKMNTSIEVM